MGNLCVLSMSVQVFFYYTSDSLCNENMETSPSRVFTQEEKKVLFYSVCHRRELYEFPISINSFYQNL